MDEADLMALIAEGESELLDFKRELRLDTARAKAEFIKDVISLANSAADVGYLIVGVDDAKLIVGTGELPEEQIQNICDTYISPPVSVRCYSIPVSTPGLPLVGIIEVRARQRPHRVARATEKLNKEDVFVRHGSVVRRATADEIIRMDEGWLRATARNRQRLTVARGKLARGNWTEAIREFSIVIDAEPSGEVYLERAEAFKKAYEITQSQEDATEVGRLRRSAYEDYCHAVDLADSVELETKARKERLIFDFNRGPEGEWDADLAWLESHSEGLRHGEVLVWEQQVYYSRSGEVSEDAIDLLTRAIGLGCDTAQAHFLRAIGHQATFNYGLALSDLDEAVGRLTQGEAKVLAEYLVSEAEVLASMERFGEAYGALEQASKSDSGTVRTMTWLTRNQSVAFVMRHALQAGFAGSALHEAAAIAAVRALAPSLDPLAISETCSNCPELRALVDRLLGWGPAELVLSGFD